ncbi:hypothetical protein A2635_03885 [Candidatus Peribacteria bacterium RIFCSPHIGHO2_01_FULL_51_9]|nr:MAG: hypothetical protein A2635_03885 [Candidatus Peribacteria bacterium RIFCSPHIGHO2_01_FULL_51_9]
MSADSTNAADTPRSPHISTGRPARTPAAPTDLAVILGQSALSLHLGTGRSTRRFVGCLANGLDAVELQFHIIRGIIHIAIRAFVLFVGTTGRHIRPQAQVSRHCALFTGRQTPIRVIIVPVITFFISIGSTIATLVLTIVGTTILVDLIAVVAFFSPFHRTIATVGGRRSDCTAASASSTSLWPRASRIFFTFFNRVIDSMSRIPGSAK